MPGPLIYTTDGNVDASSEAGLQAILARLGASPNPRLMVFMHGGLVPKQHGENTAAALETLLEPLAGDGWERLYPIWGSGLAEEVEHNREALRKNPLFVRVLLRIAAWLERHGGARAFTLAGGVPNTDDADILMAWLNRLPPPDARAAMLGLARADLSRVGLIDQPESVDLAQTDLAREFVEDPVFVARAKAHWLTVDREVRDRAIAPPPQPAMLTGTAVAPEVWVVAIAAVSAAYRVLKRFADGRDHGVGPTIFEEICRALYLDMVGAAAWDLMKVEARAHFNPGALGSRLLNAAAAIAEHKPIRVLLIGHSAGAIFTSRFVREAAALPAKATIDTILLAPAIRLDETADLLATGEARPGGLRIFTMHDAIERKNALDGTLFGHLYEGSLLYLISGVLETRLRSHGKPKSYADAPLLGLERHLTGLGKLDAGERKCQRAVHRLIAGAPDCVVYSKTAANAPPGHATTATIHGGYWCNPDTVASIIQIARHGFA